MNLTEVANQAAAEIGKTINAKFSDGDATKVAAVVAKAMESAVLEASSQHSKVCEKCLPHDWDTAHKIRDGIERKKTALIANLSSMR